MLERPDAPKQQAADGFEHMLLAYDPYRVVLPPGHRLARRPGLRLADLADERFNGPSLGTSGPYVDMLHRLCAEAGFTPDIAYVVQDVTVGRAFVAAGVSVAVMPELAIQAPRPDVVVRPARGLDAIRSLHATWLHGRRHPAIPAMARALTDAATARLGNRSHDPKPPASSSPASPA